MLIALSMPAQRYDTQVLESKVFGDRCDVAEHVHDHRWWWLYSATWRSGTATALLLGDEAALLET